MTSYENGHRGRHAARAGLALRGPWRWAILLFTTGALVAGGVAVAAPVSRFINYKVAAPVTVQALGVDNEHPDVGEPVTAGAKLVAERRQRFEIMVIAVRDEAGKIYDFPAVKDWMLGTRQKEFVQTRSFDKAGVYEYWVAFRRDGKWTSLKPKQTITVGDAATPAPQPTPSSPKPSPSTSTTPPAPPPTTTSPPPSNPIPKTFPNAGNTGVPDGVKLSTWSGSCSISTANAVIEAKTMNCDVSIRAKGVTIKNSVVNGFISIGEGSGASLTLVDSNVNAALGSPRLVTGVGSDNFLVLRSEITGGNRGVYCRRNCEVRDSWVHGTKVSGDWHASGIRASQGSRIIHNTIACDTQPTPQDGGCSADLTMYGDFEAVRDVYVEGNLFVANTGAAFCSYGGSSGGKPYSSGAADIRFINNTFQRGTNSKCAAYGPITDFNRSAPGNEFTGNVWDDGTALR